MDNVDNLCGNREIPPLFPCEIVDNPVDTVDEYALWLCIRPIYEDEYPFQQISSGDVCGERSAWTRRSLYAYRLYTVTGILQVMAEEAVA